MLRRALMGALVATSLYAGCGGTTVTEAFVRGGDGGLVDGSSANDGGTAADGAREPNTSCTGAGECVLGAPGCCGVSCGTPSSSYVGIHRGQEAALREATCSAPSPCPDCSASTDPAFQAFCRQQKCVVVDVRIDQISACRADDDCVLRPAACCPCAIAATDLVAIAKAAAEAYQKQVCDPAVACPKCAWQLPANVRARCNGSRRHCEVGTL